MDAPQVLPVQTTLKLMHPALAGSRQIIVDQFTIGQSAEAEPQAQGERDIPA
jgi:hypothetical protein